MNTDMKQIALVLYPNGFWFIRPLVETDNPFAVNDKKDTILDGVHARDGVMAAVKHAAKHGYAVVRVRYHNNQRLYVVGDYIPVEFHWYMNTLSYRVVGEEHVTSCPPCHGKDAFAEAFKSSGIKQLDC